MTAAIIFSKEVVMGGIKNALIKRVYYNYSNTHGNSTVDPMGIKAL